VIAERLPVPTDPPPAAGVLDHLGFGGCMRLPIRVDAARLANELDRLPVDAWGAAGRDPVVQASVESFFAVGQPRGPIPLPPDDRPVLAELPYLRHVVRDLVPASPTRAIVARLAPGGLIPIHRDTPRFFRGTIRLSIVVSADGVPPLYCGGRWYHMAPGEVWAIDNLKPHGIHNPGTRPRVNVLADYLPSDALARLVADGEHTRGTDDEAARRAIKTMSRERYRRSRWRGIGYQIFKALWRR